jgi:hypothetical protein
LGLPAASERTFPRLIGQPKLLLLQELLSPLQNRMPMLQSRCKGRISMVMPTRSQAEKDPKLFYELVTELLENRNPLIKKRVTLNALADVLGIDKTTVMRQLKEKKVGDDHRVLILDYLFVEKQAITGEWRERINFPHSLYFALLKFFDIKETSQDNARAHILGTYELWRYSVEEEDEFVHGKITFRTDPDTNAVCVDMIQPKKAVDDIRAATEEFEGYFIRVADMYAMLLKDKNNNDLRITIFPRFRLEQVGRHIDKDSVYEPRTPHIVHLDGFGLGIDGNNLFFSPVFLVLVDNKPKLAGLDEKLDIVPEDKVPPRILKRLRKYARILK